VFGDRSLVQDGPQEVNEHGNARLKEAKDIVLSRSNAGIQLCLILGAEGFKVGFVDVSRALYVCENLGKENGRRLRTWICGRDR
jgi:hypothetical protein